MRERERAMRAWLLFTLLLCCAGFAHADRKRSSARAGINGSDAPIPEMLVKGKRVFVSYELGDVTAFPSGFSGGPERAYSELYTQLKQWGRYELVDDPNAADLIFAVRFVDPPEVPAQIRLGIADARSHVSLWGFVEQVDPKVLKKNRNVSFSDSVSKLVSDVKTLVEQGTSGGVTQP